MALYLIWSHEHSAWWGGRRCGYVRSIAHAGTYSHAEALDICANSIPGTSRQLGALPELPVCLDDVTVMRERFRGRYPDTEREEWE
jgi:hypothetical protein